MIMLQHLLQKLSLVLMKTKQLLELLPQQMLMVIACYFHISGTELAITSAGVLTFVSAPDYETKSSYTATVTASDGYNQPLKILQLM